MAPEIRIKRLPQSRSLRLRVYDDGSITVTAPKHVPQTQIDEFVAKNAVWINQKHTAATNRREALTAKQDRLFFRGQQYQFRLAITKTQPAGVRLSAAQLVVTSQSENHQTVRTLLENWYRDQAKKRFTARVPLLADLINRDVRLVSVRDQRTRWGSCSSRNTISLNWRLIMAPDSVSDYVIYHELAHLTHMNHSRKFWALVATYFPNYREAEQWLKAHQKLLQF